MTDLHDSKMLADSRACAIPGVSDTTQVFSRVMALHAVAYCERLFYLEKIRLADERVYAGRLLHETHARLRLCP